MSNLLTVHQNLPALPVDATSDEVRKNLMDMFRIAVRFLSIPEKCFCPFAGHGRHGAS